MKTRADLTFKYNLKKGRHGWLRLTPAYSVKVVHQILDEHPEASLVLDPFSGTGTTGLVCGERGIACDLLDINPFLVWFGRVKTANYTQAQRDKVRDMTEAIIREVKQTNHHNLWLPPISNIDRWWAEGRRNLLARLYKAINELLISDDPCKELLLVAFCRCVIEWSNAAFNHQSMSFKKNQPSFWDDDEDDLLLAGFRNKVLTILESTQKTITGKVNISQADSRHVPAPKNGPYHFVITSPPYPNRMSYIRELRPYMYWLKYLHKARDAGELDWQAIGGTWGIATSRVGKWKPDNTEVNHAGFLDIIAAIAERNQLLANYVHKYFVDMTLHMNSLYPHVAPGGQVFYIVGNSKFYETLVPVEKIYASLLQNAGFVKTEVAVIRKRNSKKELYEFMVTASKP